MLGESTVLRLAVVTLRSFMAHGWEVSSVTRLSNFCTLGNFFKPLATIIFPKFLTFLGNFCKGIKIYKFSSEIIFGQLLQTFGDFYLVTLEVSRSQTFLTWHGWRGAQLFERRDKNDLNFFLKKWPIPGLFFVYFRLINKVNNVQYIFCRCLDSNRGPLVFGTTALPTVHKPNFFCPSKVYVDRKQLFGQYDIRNKLRKRLASPIRFG